MAVGDFIDGESEARSATYQTHLLLILALIFVIVAVVWDALLKTETTDLWTFRGAVWVEVVREFGFAFFIAWIVAVTIEKSSKRRQEVSVQAMQKRIADNVFRGVYSTEFPNRMIDTITRNLLKSKFVRNYIDLTYEINPLTEVDANYGKSPPFVCVRTKMDYVIRNMTDEETIFPFRLLLDQPPDPGLQKYVKLETIEIDGHDAKGKISSKKNEDGTIEYAGDFNIKPSPVLDDDPLKGLRVKIEHVIIKNNVDTVIWSTPYPTLKLDLSVIMNVKDNMFQAHALYRKEFKKTWGKPEEYEGIHTWTLDDVVLPHQGVVVFWQPKSRERSDDGADRRVLEKGSLSV
jgi:hypothetical protein